MATVTVTSTKRGSQGAAGQPVDARSARDGRDGRDAPSSRDARDARVEYGLVRNKVLRDLSRGALNRVDVCDAHPELLRAARNVGKGTDESCPICMECNTVRVTYVFGAKLPAGGRCPVSEKELISLCRRQESVACYEIEVCPQCAWHHLIRKYSAGGNSKTTKASGAAKRPGAPTKSLL